MMISDVVTLGQEALWVTALIAGPLLLGILVVGRGRWHPSSRDVGSGDDIELYSKAHCTRASAVPRR